MKVEKVKSNQKEFSALCNGAPPHYKLVKIDSTYKVGDYYFVLHKKVKDPSKWAVSHLSTGATVAHNLGRGFTTKKEALAGLSEIMHEKYDKMQQAIHSFVNINVASNAQAIKPIDLLILNLI